MYLGVMSESTDPSSQLGSELVMYSARLVRALRRQLHVPAWVRVLSILDELGPQGISQLAQADNCSQPTMSAAVAGLVSQGLVSKEGHPTDARSSIVALTEQGRAELADVRRRYNERVLARLQERGRPLEDVATAVAVMADLLPDM
jgi:DNA-binding MarR family transcriptional regulator